MSSSETRRPSWLERRAQARATLVDDRAIERQHAKALGQGAPRGAWLGSLTSRAASDVEGDGAWLPRVAALPSRGDASGGDASGSDASGSDASSSDASSGPRVSSAAARHAQRLLSPGRIDVRAALPGVARALDVGRSPLVERLTSRAASLAPSSPASAAEDKPLRTASASPARAGGAVRPPSAEAAPEVAPAIGSASRAPGAPASAAAPSGGRALPVTAGKDTGSATFRVPSAPPPGAGDAPRPATLSNATVARGLAPRAPVVAPAARDVSGSPAPALPRASGSLPSRSAASAFELTSRERARSSPPAEQTALAAPSHRRDERALASPTLPPALAPGRLQPAARSGAKPAKDASARERPAGEAPAASERPRVASAHPPLALAGPAPLAERRSGDTVLARASAPKDSPPAQAQTLAWRAPASGARNGASSSSAHAAAPRSATLDAAADAPAAAASPVTVLPAAAALPAAGATRAAASAAAPSRAAAPLPLATALPSASPGRRAGGSPVVARATSSKDAAAQAPNLVWRAPAISAANGAPGSVAHSGTQRASTFDAASDSRAAAAAPFAMPSTATPSAAMPSGALSSSSRVDVGALARQVTSLIVRQFEIERERRGGGRWW